MLVLQILVSTIIYNLKLLEALTESTLFDVTVFGLVSLWTPVFGEALTHPPAQAELFQPFQRFKAPLWDAEGTERTTQNPHN